MDLDPTTLQRRSELLAAGYSDGELRRMLSTGDMTRIRRGAYLAGAHAQQLDDVELHAMRIRAARPVLAPAAVISHASAAVLYGWPMWDVPLDRVHLTHPRRSGGRRTAALHVHTASMDDDEFNAVGGLAVTAPARTVVDLARTLPFEQAVVVADSALRVRAVSSAGLSAALERSAHRRGNTRARRVVAFADGASESVGESRSRVAIARAGLPLPLLQWQVPGGAGRVDFAWPELRTVGEFDGRIKYGRLLRPGQEPGDACSPRNSARTRSATRTSA